MSSQFEDIKFVPDKVKVHEKGAIKLICANFRSHETGLPEWLKNSSDMYLRSESDPNESVILLLFRDGNSKRPSAIGCLDFGGMTTEDIEDKFRIWADPDASGAETIKDVEGGHGNGGKCYMTQLFESHSCVHTVKEGRGNKYGFKGNDATPGYMDEGRGYAVPNPEKELVSALKAFDLSLDNLPEVARKVWEKQKSFTLVVGFAAKHHANTKLPVKSWIENIQGHQQTIQSIRRNKIYVFYNGKGIEGAAPLTLAQIDPIPGAETSKIIIIPPKLIDPVTEKEIETGAVRGQSRLVLKTSEKSMRYTLKSRHTINGWAFEKRSTGYWDVYELSRAPYASKIYGDIYLDALNDYRQNDRRNHSPAPLTRAITHWLTSEIEAYSAEFVKMEQLHASKEERNALSKMNEALNEWKNKFLEKEMGGLGGKGNGKGDDDESRVRLPIGIPASLILRLTHSVAGRGVVFKPSLEFFDKDGKRIRSVPFHWESSDWAVATVNEDLNLITTHNPGTTEIRAVCKDSGLTSNSVRLEVLEIAKISLSPTEMELPLGGRLPLTAKVTTRDGREVEGVYLIWAAGDDIISVGSGGMVFGIQLGNSTVSAGDDYVLSEQPAKVTVIKVDKEKSGGGFPRILLSEIDPDPLGLAPFLVLNAAEPPVYQRVQDVERSIWWVNMASPLARRYVDAARGSGTKSREWRLYLLERYIEIMVKICLIYKYDLGHDMTLDTMLHSWDEESAQMQANAIESLEGFLDTGDLPLAEAA